MNVILVFITLCKTFQNQFYLTIIKSNITIIFLYGTIFPRQGSVYIKLIIIHNNSY